MTRRHIEDPSAAIKYLNQQGARVAYYPGFFSAAVADQFLHRLHDSLEWNSREESMIRRPFSSEKVHIPRLQTAYGGPAVSYRFSGVSVQARPWIPVLIELREIIRRRLGYESNFVLANLYRTGEDCIGWHSDDEADLGETPVIVSMTFGAERDFQFRKKTIAPCPDDVRLVGNDLVTLELAHGSVLVMEDPTNKLFRHQLPKRKRCSEARLNLTWRSIAL